jgi:hypothetical protein
LTFGPTLDTSEICNFQFEENNIYETYFSFFLAASKLVNNQVNSGWGSGIFNILNLNFKINIFLNLKFTVKMYERNE